MTRDYLEAHFRLREMLNRARERYDALLTRAQPGAQNLDGMPKGTASRRGEDMAITLAEVGQSVDELTKEVERSQGAVQEWIRTFPDPDIRAVMSARYLEALPWAEVAKRLNFTEGQCLLRFYKARERLER